MKKLWTIWFVVAAMVTVMAACGDDPQLSPIGGNDDADTGTSQPSTGGNDAGAQQNANTGTDTGTPTREDAGAAVSADAEQPAQQSDAGQTGEDSGAVQAPANVDVLRSSGACQLKFSALYVNGAANGELRGSIPDVMTWDAGPAMSDSDADGYLEYAPASLPVGTFDLSYLGDGSWAMYGTEAQLRAMSAAARAFVSCNWFDGTNIIAVASPECHLRIKVETGCLVSGAGNMANLQ